MLCRQHKCTSIKLEKGNNSNLTDWGIVASKLVSKCFILVNYHMIQSQLQFYSAVELKTAEHHSLLKMVIELELKQFV